MIKPRKVASLLLATALPLAILPGAAVARPTAAAEAPEPPGTHQLQPQRNVIFVLVDDLRFDAMGFLRRGLRTPNIDFLARNGVYFKNAVVTSSNVSSAGLPAGGFGMLRWIATTGFSSSRYA